MAYGGDAAAYGAVSGHAEPEGGRATAFSAATPGFAGAAPGKAAPYAGAVPTFVVPDDEAAGFNAGASAFDDANSVGTVMLPDLSVAAGEPAGGKKSPWNVDGARC